MPSRARIKQGGEPHHIIQRGNNRSACFFSKEDYLGKESLITITIRTAINSGLVLGGERFKDQTEAALSRTVHAGKAGRPKKRRSEPDAPGNNEQIMRWRDKNGK